MGLAATAGFAPPLPPPLSLPLPPPPPPPPRTPFVVETPATAVEDGAGGVAPLVKPFDVGFLGGGGGGTSSASAAPFPFLSRFMSSPKSETVTENFTVTVGTSECFSTLNTREQDTRARRRGEARAPGFARLKAGLGRRLERVRSWCGRPGVACVRASERACGVVWCRFFPPLILRSSRWCVRATRLLQSSYLLEETREQRRFRTKKKQRRVPLLHRVAVDHRTKKQK